MTPDSGRPEGERGKDRPISFKAPMVRALLSGAKTQTRRIVKIPALMGNLVSVGPHEELIELDDGQFRSGICHYASTGALSGPYRLPYAVGDRLWVRERFHLRPVMSAETALSYADEEDASIVGGWKVLRPCGMRFAKRPAKPAWKPSIHMPRWASRLTLHVTDVRVQRLQEIKGLDIIAEGVRCQLCYSTGQSACRDGGCFEQRDDFRNLWNSLHGPDAWDANPWVAAISFRVQRANIDALPSPQSEREA